MLFRRMISFSIAMKIRLICRIFYRFEIGWVNSPKEDPWKGVKLFVFLNHTSLYEPLFIGAFPYRFVWRSSGHGVVPGAEKTLSRPIVGLFYKTLLPKIVSITRKRDNSWDSFKDQVDDDAMVLILPEGRMLRKTGLDSEGKKMSVRAGIAEIIKQIPEGNMVIAYSGGLHHIQAPGEFFPKVFKKIKINYEGLKIEDYRDELMAREGDFTTHVIEDLTKRRDQHCPV